MFHKAFKKALFISWINLKKKHFDKQRCTSYKKKLNMMLLLNPTQYKNLVQKLHPNKQSKFTNTTTK